MKMNKNNKKLICWVVGIIAFALLLVLDQFTKSLAVSNLAGQDPIALIPGVFELQYLENRGAAFGMFQNQRWLFLIMAVIILAFIGYCFQKFPVNKHYLWLRITAVLLGAGAVGNMIDRVMNGFVVDFFYFSLIDFPIFNVADCYVVVSLILLIILIFFYYKEEDFACLALRQKAASKEEN